MQNFPRHFIGLGHFSFEDPEQAIRTSFDFDSSWEALEGSDLIESAEKQCASICTEPLDTFSFPENRRKPPSDALPLTLSKLSLNDPHYLNFSFRKNFIKTINTPINPPYSAHQIEKSADFEPFAPHSWHQLSPNSDQEYARNLGGWLYQQGRSARMALSKSNDAMCFAFLQAIMRARRQLTPSHQKVFSLSALLHPSAYSTFDLAMQQKAPLTLAYLFMEDRYHSILWLAMREQCNINPAQDSDIRVIDFAVKNGFSYQLAAIWRFDPTKNDPLDKVRDLAEKLANKNTQCLYESFFEGLPQSASANKHYFGSLLHTPHIAAILPQNCLRWLESMPTSSPAYDA